MINNFSKTTFAGSVASFIMNYKKLLKKIPIKTENHFAVIFTFIFFLIACLGVFHHEMWSDETHAWLIACDSHSLGELFFNKRYEGHPILWYVILFVLTW